MDNTNPSQGNTESPSVQPGTVDQFTMEAEAEKALEQFALENIDDFAPQNEEEEESEVATESEEPTELEEQVEEVDVDTPDEAEEAPVEEDSDQQSELELVSYDDLKGYALEIGGENYTAAQLKSMIGRMKAAGEDARKADQAVKELDAKKAQLAEQEQWLQQRATAASQSDQLAEMAADARKINAKIEKARSESDMYEVAVQKDKLDVLKGEYAKTQRQVQQVQTQAEAKQVAAAEQGLKDRGLGYLLEDNPQAKAWTSYAESNLSAQELNAVQLIPSLAAMVEKARKYDASTKTKGVKLKSSGKTLKPGVNQPKKLNTTPKVDYTNNPDAYFQALANGKI